MATIAQNIETLNTIKNDIKTAINNKGVTVTDSDSFTLYASKIDQIKQGEGGGAEPVLESISITSNGIYTPPSGVDGYNEVSVNVTTGGDSTNYSYYDGSIDEAGLRAIGWDDESIGYLRDNVPHYAWQNSDYIVSEENKALYGVVNADNIYNVINNPNLVFLPKFNWGFGIKINSDYIKAIPMTNNKEISSIVCDGSKSLLTIPPFNTSKAGTITFGNCKSLICLPPLDTSNATRMSFSDCTSLKTLPPLNTSKLTIMSTMFSGCISLTTIPQIDTSNVTNMSYMFGNCASLKTIPEMNTSNVTNMQSMFYNCASLKTIPEIDTSNVTNMDYFLEGCNSLESVPSLDTSKVTKFSSGFNTCSSLKSLGMLDFSSISGTSNLSYFFGYSNITGLTYLGGFKNLKVDWNDNNGLRLLPNITYQSIMNVINYLYDFRANGETTTRTLKINSNTYSLLSEDDIGIATSKGWTISK